MARGRAGLVLALAGALLIVALIIGVQFGSDEASLVRATLEPSSTDHRIIFGARAPRVALGAISGAGLAAVGVALQAVLRNPLAEPYVLGVSGGAALGATIAILAGASVTTILGASLVPIAALVGGLGATALVYALARGGTGARATSLLLAGVVVNAIASAGITFLKTLVSASKAQELLLWLMGFLDVPSPQMLTSVTIYVAIGVAIIARDAARLNVLALGDDSAAHLGVNVRALERRTILACSIVVGAIVSVTGLIGFVGLVVPHALRRIIGNDARVLVPASILGGAASLVLCDLASRASFRFLHTEPPVGAVTALIGGPVFLAILRAPRERSYM